MNILLNGCVRRPAAELIRAVGLVVFAAALFGALGNPARAQQPDKVVVGYVYFSTAGIDYSLYTHISHAFVVADADGGIRRNDHVPSKVLCDAAHASKVRILLSLGGWGWDKQFAAIVSKPEAESRYVKSVLAMVDEFDYDGLDLDWEYPDTKEEMRGFERLVRRLRDGLDAIGKRKERRLELTMAVSASLKTIRWLRPTFVNDSFDWLNIMTYDLSGDWTPYAGHNAPLHNSSRQPRGEPLSVERTMRFAIEQHKIPADKLALGVPLYGQCFAVAEPYAMKSKDTPRTRLPGGEYRSVHKLLGGPGWKRVWDDETKVPWLIANDKSAVIGYDDPESVALKARFAREKSLRGVFFWEISLDQMPDGSHPLQKAARAAFLD